MAQFRIAIAALVSKSVVSGFPIMGSDSRVEADEIKNVKTLSPAEIAEFQEMVRDYHDRPVQFIPVSEGGTTYGDINLTGRIGKDKPTVSCGGHEASSCELCPQGNGAAWCNGDCIWNHESMQCENHPDKRCDDDGQITRSKCSDCSSTQCTGTLDCELMPETNLCRYVLKDDSRSASTHLHYYVPQDLKKPAWWFQRLEIESATDSSYFATSGHRFGYAGFQQSSDSPFEGRILFSIWDQGGCDQDKDPNCPPEQIAKTVLCGTGVKCVDFGGEGTGRKSIIYSGDVPLTEQPYYMVVHAKHAGRYRMQYSAYFYIPDKKSWGSSEHERGPYIGTSPGWRFLSRIEVGTDAQEQWHIRNLYSFVEQWAPIKGLSTRAGLFGASFVAEQDFTGGAASFEQIRKAHFGYGTLENHKHVNAWSTSDRSGSVGMEIGGDVVKKTMNHQVFEIPQVDEPPELIEFANSSGCLAKALTVVEIEACLQKNNEAGPMLMQYHS